MTGNSRVHANIEKTAGKQFEHGQEYKPSVTIDHNNNEVLAGTARDQQEQHIQIGAIDGILRSLKIGATSAQLEIEVAYGVVDISGYIRNHDDISEVVVNRAVPRLIERLGQFANEYPDSSFKITFEMEISLE